MDFAAHLENWQRRLLADAQTSGGLLAAVAPEIADEVLSAFRDAGFAQAAVIGAMVGGAARVAVLKWRGRWTKCDSVPVRFWACG